MQKNNTNGTQASSSRNEVSIAVVNEKMNNLEKSMADNKEEQKATRRDIQSLSEKIDNTYATKSDLINTAKDVESLRSNLSWGVKIVIGAVIVAVLGLIIRQNVQ